MSINPTYPGVYIQEIPNSVHTIQGVNTSTTAFIGLAKKGPTNQATTIRSFVEYERIFGGLSRKSNMSYAVYHYFINGGSDAVVVRVHECAKTATYEIDDSDLKLQASSAGIWGANLDIRIGHNLDDNINSNNSSRDQDDTNAFSLIVKETDTTAYEIFRNLSPRHNDKRFITNLLKQWSNLIRVSGYVSEEKRIPEGNFKLVRDSASDGNHCLSDNTVIGKPGTPSTGIYSLDETDIFNMLCIMPYNRNNTTSSNVYVKASEYCEARNAILIVDPPDNWTAATYDVDTEFESIHRENAALFFPRIKAQDPLDDNNGLRNFVPSGFVAGVIATTDRDRGVWKAPAGIESRLAGVSDLTVLLTDDENGTLNQKGVNCLRTITIHGIVVWGSRTMSKINQWQYLPVRRTALYIEESLYRGTQWAVFEPNDEPLWSQIRIRGSAFMNHLFRKGAFQGNSPEEAYFVKCDNETTTQADINKGRLNIVIGFAPQKPAEFILLKITQHVGCNRNRNEPRA
jgi:uncharacterized protein